MKGAPEEYVLNFGSSATTPPPPATPPSCSFAGYECTRGASGGGLASLSGGGRPCATRGTVLAATNILVLFSRRFPISLAPRVSVQLREKRHDGEIRQHSLTLNKNSYVDVLSSQILNTLTTRWIREVCTYIKLFEDFIRAHG